MKVRRLPDRRPPAVEFAPPVADWIHLVADLIIKDLRKEGRFTTEHTGEGSTRT